MDPLIAFFRRIGLAFVAFFLVLFNREFAARVASLRQRRPTLEPSPSGRSEDSAEGLQVLAMLQREGRFVDFLQEDLASFSDSEVGAAARAVHDGCRKMLSAYLKLEPIFQEPEGMSIVVADGFDPTSVRLTGNVVGTPPFKGSLKHHGWRAREVRLPRPPEGLDPSILAPAEVEIS
jgi:hypothetical protein